MNWRPIFALLIFFSTMTTYIASLLIDKYKTNEKLKRFFLVSNLILNFGLLFIFKYYNFLNETIISTLELIGIRWEMNNLDILLPVGISFYTFQAAAYTIDVYKGNFKAERHFGYYALFVSFFPQLVAGPIERTAHLLPQFKVIQKFNYNRFLLGFSMILWGLFIKVCIADRVAIYVNAVFNNADKHNGTSFSLAIFLFAIQIYCDFSGYSGIAIGSAKIMGYDLMENFKRPYFSRNISEFWSRWHISLSTWFRDYVYIPLGGNRVNTFFHLRNLFITFLLSGLWHGANWSFVIWGFLHAIFLILGILQKKYFHFELFKTLSEKSKLFYNIKYAIDVLTTFILVTFAWIYFRADNVEIANRIINSIFFNHGALFLNKTELLYAFFSIIILLIKEINDEFKLNINFMSSKNIYIKYASFAIMIYIIILFGVVDSNQFIYFQF
jgi:D-alanyl-lipoteichoic acid acyltransferase DltB (MBOAT superfamily)